MVGVVILVLVGVASWCTARTGDVVWWMACSVMMAVVSSRIARGSRMGGARGGLKLNTDMHTFISSWTASLQARSVKCTSVNRLVLA